MAAAQRARRRRRPSAEPTSMPTSTWSWSAAGHNGLVCRRLPGAGRGAHDGGRGPGDGRGLRLHGRRRSAPGSTSATATTSPSAPCPWSRSSTSTAHGLRYLDLDPVQVAPVVVGRTGPAVLFHDAERTLDVAGGSPTPTRWRATGPTCGPPCPWPAWSWTWPPAAPTPGRALGTVARRRAAGASARWRAGPGARWPRCCAATSPARRCSARPSPLGPAVWGVSPHLPGTGLGRAALRPPPRRGAGSAGGRAPAP